MKKTIALLFIMPLMLAMTGCAGNAASAEDNAITGYITVEENTLYLEDVEVVTIDDYDRVCELGV